MTYYHHALYEFGWTPRQWSELSKREMALVIAGIQLRAKEEEKQRKDAERKAKARRRR